MRNVTILLLLFLVSLCASAQTGSEIYLFDLKIKGETLILRHPENITRHKGYDNQPFFHPDRPLLYYASADSTGRTDILQYDYKKDVTKKVTQTHDREYSPTVTPDKKFISCIIQRDSGAQDLGKYPITGGPEQMIIDNLIVGYHAWADETHLAVFTLPQPFKLHIIDVRSRKDTVVAENVGRALHKIPGSYAISFTQKITDAEWRICKLDLTTMKISVLTNGLNEKEPNITWTQNGVLITNDGQRIFSFIPGKSTQWNQAETDTILPPNTVTRMAVNTRGDKFALVMNE